MNHICPTCGQALPVDEALADKSFTCPVCGHSGVVPQKATQKPASSPVPVKVWEKINEKIDTWRASPSSRTRPRWLKIAGLVVAFVLIVLLGLALKPGSQPTPPSTDKTKQTEP